MNLFTSPAVSSIVDPAVRAVLGRLHAWLTDTPHLRIHQFDSLYTQPMYMSLDAEPAGLLCLRVREKPRLEEVFNVGQSVWFTWDGGRSRAVIKNIDGMIGGTGKEYRFHFLVIG